MHCAYYVTPTFHTPLYWSMQSVLSRFGLTYCNRLNYKDLLLAILENHYLGGGGGGWGGGVGAGQLLEYISLLTVRPVS